ncbi:hypothetical protein [Curtobacterium flaccumfaciens]|uniref:hypothetical protein n=1 Tax=Curtobacterium flaccumfaciens TaxID=2035 RepID=UPI001603BC0B|nr:hypothetical protein [Curtobacterium flaccumfaciens]MBB1195858.1 hypothetical protein [Curtobacterium flaccumfaciens]
MENTVAAHRTLGGSSTVAFDANRYAGSGRSYGADNLQPGWLQAQDDLGLSFLTLDSGYIVDGDWDGVQRLLEAGALGTERFGDRVHIDLPVDARMVRDAPERLIDLIAQYGSRVTLKLGHRADPLARPDTVAALVQVLDASHRVSLGRTDLAGVGALAVGAEYVSIGTTTSLRHVYPPVKRSGGGGRNVDFALIVPRALQFRQHARVLEVIALDPDNPRWVCGCGPCEGRSLERIRSEEQAWEHSLAIIYDRAAALTALPTRHERLRHWSETCAYADFENRDLRDEMPDWPVPDNHSAWKSALDDLIEHTSSKSQ